MEASTSRTLRARAQEVLQIASSEIKFERGRGIAMGNVCVIRNL